MPKPNQSQTSPDSIVADDIVVNDKRVYKGLIVCNLGLFFIFFGIVLGHFLSLLIVGLGLGLAGVGLYDLFVSLNLKCLFEKFRKDEQGLGWQILVFICGLAAFSIVWFVVAWPADMVFNAVSDIYIFSGITGSAVVLVRGLISLLPGIGLLFLVIWLWVNANRQEALSF